MKYEPYVGITGLKSREDVNAMNQLFLYAGFFEPESNHTPMFGYLCSEKKMANKSDTSGRGPSPNHLAELTELAYPTVLTMVHYHTRNHDNLAEQIDEVFSLNKLYENNHCRALQLNVVWPRVSEVEKIMQQYPEMEIVLQLSKKAMDQPVEEILKQAQEYDHLVSYTLIDPSGGKGIPFDVKNSVELMNQLKRVMPTTRIGVAGGFSPQNVKERIKLIGEQFQKDFCIDAEGNLMVDNQLGYDKCSGYISESSSALGLPKNSDAYLGNNLESVVKIQKKFVHAESPHLLIPINEFNPLSSKQLQQILELEYPFEDTDVIDFGADKRFARRLTIAATCKDAEEKGLYEASEHYASEIDLEI
jgi:hypothetical protein